MTIEKQSAFPTQYQCGLSKQEYILLNILNGYISAGSTGMPTPDKLVELAIETTRELFKQMKQNNL